MEETKVKNWKKTGIAALCVAALLAGCGTQGGKDDKEDDTIGAVVITQPAVASAACE